GLFFHPDRRCATGRARRTDRYPPAPATVRGRRHVGMAGPFHIIEFAAEADDDVLYLETDTSSYAATASASPARRAAAAGVASSAASPATRRSSRPTTYARSTRTSSG